MAMAICKEEKMEAYDEEKMEARKEEKLDVNVVMVRCKMFN